MANRRRGSSGHNRPGACEISCTENPTRSAASGRDISISSDRLEDLLFERGDAAVPKERAAVSPVDESRGIAAPLTAQHADRDRAAVGERALRIMAGGATHRTVAREAAVEEQPPPLLDFCAGEWILL